MHKIVSHWAQYMGPFSHKIELLVLNLQMYTHLKLIDILVQILTPYLKKKVMFV